MEKIFHLSTFWKNCRKIVSSRNAKKEKNDRTIKKFDINSLFGDTIRKVMDYKHAFKKERWIKIAHDDRVYEYHKLEHEDFIVEKN